MPTPQRQQGFTLIELIIVIVILGILAAVAVPKFVDLSDEADEASVKAAASAISSAMAINYAACSLSDDADKCTTITSTSCDNDDTGLRGEIDDLLTSPLDDRFTIDESDPDETLADASGDSFVCNLSSSDGNEAEFTVIYTGN